MIEPVEEEYQADDHNAGAGHHQNIESQLSPRSFRARRIETSLWNKRFEKFDGIA